MTNQTDPRATFTAAQPPPGTLHPTHPRTVGWFGTTAVAMGGINQSLFLLGALFVGQDAIPGQGSAAVILLAVGLLLSWMATPGWTELILMYPNRVGGIAATCAEAFRPYSPVLANLTGVCYWWGWVPTCGLTALLASSAITQWYLPGIPVPLLATGIVVFFTFINLCGVKWVMRLAMPIAVTAAMLAFASAVIPVFSGSVDWQKAFTFQLTVPFDGWFGQVTSIMAGLYLIGFAAPAFEQAACHVGETISPNKNVPRAMFASAALASLYFVVLPLVWLGTLGPEPLGKELALELGPTLAPLLGGAAKAAAVWFMIFNMLHGTIAPLAGASRTLAQLSEDGLLPTSLAKRSRTDAPWVATLLTAAMSILFLLIGDPVWLIAAANLTYLVGIAMPSVAVWLLRHNEPDALRPYRAPRGTIVLGLCAAGVWALTVILGFQQFGLRTVLIGIGFAYSGSVLYAWRKFSDRRKRGLPGIARTLHLKLTGAMLLVLVLDAAGYLVAVDHVPKSDAALIAMLEDIFVAVALLTVAVGLVLPGMIAHSAVQVSEATQKLVLGTLTDFTRAMRALAAGDLDAAKAHIDLQTVKVYSRDEVGDMALNFNRLQSEIASAAEGLDGARQGLSQARQSITEVNARLSVALVSADAALKELESQKHALDEHSIVGITDIRGRITYANDRFCAISGYTRAELLGQDHRIVNSGHHPEEFFREFWATISSGRVWQGEIKNHAKGGTAYWVDTTVVPFLDDDGRPIQYVSIRTDITQSKLLTQALSAAKDVAEAASVAKTRFLANMSHELRTPLNAVIGAAQLLRAGAGDEASQTQMVQAIQTSGTNLLGLIENILDLSRIEAGELKLVQEDFHLWDCIEAALATARLSARAKGLALTCIVQPEVQPWRQGDANRMRQVLLNLLGNAVKFTRTGEIELRVERGAQAQDLRISLSDTGVGIGAASLPHIFEPFRQAEDGANRRFGGSGLGLSIVHQLVQAMGGRIGVRSTLGRGTRFDIELRLAPAKAIAPARVPPLPVPLVEPLQLPAHGRSVAPAHVLVVEDDLLNQTIVCRLLSHAGYTSTAASDGAQALALLAAQHFDLVLMDWQMPEMDGLEVTRRMRAGEAGPAGQTVPIVALTANAFAEDRAACLDAGMNDFLTKPVLAERLIAAVQRWTQGTVAGRPQAERISHE